MKRDPNLHVFDHAHKRGYKYHGKPLPIDVRRETDHMVRTQKTKIVLIVVLLTAAWALNGFPMP